MSLVNKLIVTNEQVKEFNANGVILIKNVFSINEILKLRNYVKTLQNKNLKGDFSDDNILVDLLSNEKILTIAKSLLGSNEIMYFGKSTIFNEVNKNVGNFHHDAKIINDDRKNDEFPVIRFALFLQDHAKYSGGIKMRLGSHKYKILKNKINIFSFAFKLCKNLLIRKSKKDRLINLEFPSFSLSPSTKSVNMSSEEGDLIVFNLRTYHCGRFVRFKYLPKLVLPPIIERYLPKFLQVPREKDRYALFIDYARRFSRLDEYILNRAHGPEKEHYKNSKFDNPKFISLMKQKGVEVCLTGKS